jgi:hypothetical protein
MPPRRDFAYAYMTVGAYLYVSQDILSSHSFTDMLCFAIHHNESLLDIGGYT